MLFDHYSTGIRDAPVPMKVMSLETEVNEIIEIRNALVTRICLRALRTSLIKRKVFEENFKKQEKWVSQSLRKKRM